MTHQISAADHPRARRHGQARPGGLRYAMGAVAFLAAVMGLFLVAGFSF
ncbi:hypothetical protein [Rhodovarius crocodyli]|nr:hypothetical protein [Rhodovarius crocodyli]